MDIVSLLIVWLALFVSTSVGEIASGWGNCSALKTRSRQGI